MLFPKIRSHLHHIRIIALLDEVEILLFRVFIFLELWNRLKVIVLVQITVNQIVRTHDSSKRGIKIYFIPFTSHKIFIPLNHQTSQQSLLPNRQFLYLVGDYSGAHDFVFGHQYEDFLVWKHIVIYNSLFVDVIINEHPRVFSYVIEHLVGRLRLGVISTW